MVLPVTGSGVNSAKLLIPNSILQFKPKPKANMLTRKCANFPYFRCPVTITLYNQFKSVPKTEISGFVSADRNTVIPVDAVVKIISPIQSETQTDSKGRFK